MSRVLRALALAALLALAAAAPAAAASVEVRLLVTGTPGGARLAGTAGATALAAPGTATSRLAVAAGDELRALAAGGGVLATARAGTAPRQTLVLLRDGRLLRFDDQPAAPADATRFRVAHVAPGVGPLDVRLRRGALLAAGLAFGGLSGTVDVPASATAACGGVAELDVRPAGQVAPGAAPKVPALAGAAATVYIWAYRPGELYPLDYVTLVDARAGAAAAPRAAPRSPRPRPGIRLFHAIHGAPPVRLLIDGAARARVHYGGTSGHVRVAAGRHVVRVVLRGRTLARAVVRTTVARPRLTVALHGASTGRARLLVLGDAPPADAATARLRLVHVSEGAPTLSARAVLTGATLVRRVAYERATAFLRVPAAAFAPCFGLLRLDLAAARGGPVLKHARISVAEGRAYTAFVIRPPSAPRGGVKLVLVDEAA